MFGGTEKPPRFVALALRRVRMRPRCVVHPLPSKSEDAAEATWPAVAAGMRKPVRLPEGLLPCAYDE